MFQKCLRFVREKRGAVVIVFALAMPVLIGGAGLGTEVGFWYLQQRQLQTAADVAANAGAIELRSGGVKSKVKAAAETEAAEHGFNPTTDEIDVNSPPLSGSHRNDRAVEVLLRSETPRYFTALFSKDPVTFNVRAVAQYDSTQEACLLALDTWSSDAVIFIGNPTATFDGCVVMSNSLADDSITIAGSADVTASCVVSAGKASITADLTLTDCAAPQEEMPQAADPYDHLPEPPLPAACSPVPKAKKDEVTSLSAGRYCGGLALKGDYALDSGVYVIDGGSFRINSNSVVTGANVTFFLTNGATVDFNGSATVTLSAPTSGTYSGVLMFGDRATRPTQPTPSTARSTPT